MTRKLDNRCKFCRNRRKLHCPLKKKFVGPQHEVFGCDKFKQRDLGKPLEQKKKGSLGSG